MTDTKAMEYFPISVRRAEWGNEQQNILKHRAYFLANMDIEHLFDIHAHHYLATVNNTAAGYLCIDADGHISLVAAKDDHASDIIDALLRFAVMDGPRRGLSQLSAPAAHPWKDALLKLQFTTENSNNDHQLTLFLPPDRSGTVSGSRLVRLEKIDDFRQHAIQLVQQARRSVVIFSEDLEAWLYDNDDFATAMMELAQKSRNSSIRLLVRDTRSLIERGHRLLRLSHRASEKILIRKLPTHQTERLPCYLITDDNGLMFRQDPLVMQGVGYFDYRARTKPLLEQFELLWARSGSDPDLRQQTI